MKFYTDGSRIGLQKGDVYLGWGAVCDAGVVCTGSQIGGSNINAEIFAIRDLLEKLTKWKRKLVENETIIEIETDSLTSIQIITGCLKNPNDYDVNESVNYESAHYIVNNIGKLKEIGKDVKFIHVRGHQKNLGNNFADYVATQESMLLQMKTKQIV